MLCAKLSQVFPLIVIGGILSIHTATCETLQLVHVIFRHGNRTTIPSMIYASDPHINETYYPFGQAELTLVGKQLAYSVGLEMRERYDHILKDTYAPVDIQAFTSNTSRTQMTLQSILTAMYPPVWPNVVEPYLMWQPISYQTIPTEEDNLLNVYCETVNNFTTKRGTSLNQLYQYVSEHAGEEMTNSAKMMDVYNTILVEKQNGFDVPDWAEEIFQNGSLQDAALTLWTDYIDQKLPQLAGGLIKKITEDSVRKIRNEIENNIFLYSAHDTTIAVLLGVFDAYEKSRRFEIEYLAQIYIELHKINEEYGFKVFFINGPGYPLVPLKARGCPGDFCPLEQFIAATKDVYTPEVAC